MRRGEMAELRRLLVLADAKRHNCPEPRKLLGKWRDRARRAAKKDATLRPRKDVMQRLREQEARNRKDEERLAALGINLTEGTNDDQ